MDPFSIFRLFRILADRPDVVLIGGQAVLTWASYYEDAPEFAQSDAALTTGDLDFLGSSRIAKEVAAELGASAPKIPDSDDHTPSAGIIDLGNAGRDEERVDFLSYVQGPGDRVGKAAVTIDIENLVGKPGDTISVRIMHPMHCLESKLANRVTLGRASITAQTQLEATVPILREFVSEMLAAGNGDHRSAAARMALDALNHLARYLRSDTIGKQADKFMTRDPLSILRHFAEDARLPLLFRQHNIAKAIVGIEKMRQSRDRPRPTKKPKP
jgi:hypothetical protein